MSANQNWYQVSAAAGKDTAEIHIFGKIVDYTLDETDMSAKKFIDQLKALGDRIKILKLFINSPGGSVPAGLAIYNALKRHPARVEVSIDGMAASMASVIAMAGDLVTMPENALMMVHNPAALAFGDARLLRKAAEMLDKAREVMIPAYRDKSKLDPAEIERLMDEETWLTAAEAVEKGFADQMEKPVKMAASFDLSRFRNTPAALLQPEPIFPLENTGTFEEAVNHHMRKTGCTRQRAIWAVARSNPDMHSQYQAFLKERYRTH